MLFSGVSDTMVFAIMEHSPGADRKKKPGIKRSPSISKDWAETQADVKGEPNFKKEVRVKVEAEQNTHPGVDSLSGRPLPSTLIPSEKTQKAATTVKFALIPGKGLCPVCMRILSKKYLPAHLLDKHGAVNSLAPPNGSTHLFCLFGSGPMWNHVVSPVPDRGNRSREKYAGGSGVPGP